MGGTALPPGKNPLYQHYYPFHRGDRRSGDQPSGVATSALLISISAEHQASTSTRGGNKKNSGQTDTGCEVEMRKHIRCIVYF